MVFHIQDGVLKNRTSQEQNEEFKMVAPMKVGYVGNEDRGSVSQISMATQIPQKCHMDTYSVL